MTNSETPTTKTDRYGFPIVECSRCGGCGRYSFNSLDGDRCYGCSGTGWQHPAEVAPIVAEFRDAQKAIVRPLAHQLAVGDVVTFDHSRGATFRTIAAIEVGEPVWTVRYDDGTETRVNRTQIARRKGKVDPAPYIARISA